MKLKYEPVSSPLTVYFQSDDLDILQVGIIGMEVHRLLNQVAVAILEDENRARESQKQPLLEYHLPLTLTRDDVLIRGRITQVKQGSIELDIAALLAEVFSQPGATAILQNLISTAIWTIAEYASKVIGCNVKSKKLTKAYSSLPKTSSKKKLGPIVQRVLKELKGASNGGRFVMKSGIDFVEIEFYKSDGNSQNTVNGPTKQST